MMEKRTQRRRPLWLVSVNGSCSEMCIDIYSRNENRLEESFTVAEEQTLSLPIDSLVVSSLDAIV